MGLGRIFSAAMIHFDQFFYEPESKMFQKDLAAKTRQTTLNHITAVNSGQRKNFPISSLTPSQRLLPFLQRHSALRVQYQKPREHFQQK